MFTPRWTTHNYAGTTLQVLLADTTGERWYDHDWEPLPEMALMKQSKLKPGAIVFDCGAHHGVVASMLATDVTSTGSVVAIEGLPSNADVAKQIVERNQLGNVAVIQAAVSDKPGTVRFRTSQVGNSNGSIATTEDETVEVTATTVDLLAETHGWPDVLYIDVEGAELAVLAGASKALESRPDLLIEVHVGYGLEALGGSAAQVIDQVRTMGYEMWAYNDLGIDTPLPLDEAPPAIVEDRFFIIAINGAA